MSDWEDRLRRAIAELLKELESDPTDPRLLQKLAELHLKVGEDLRAAEYLLQVAASYESDGFFLKAAAVLNQVLKLRPGHLVAHERLASTYVSLGLASDAIPHLEVMANAHAQAGDVAGAQRLYDRLCELDPKWRPKNPN